MAQEANKTIGYSLWDPAGNVTALVHPGVKETQYAAVAAAIQQERPEVEQVGFLKVLSDDPEGAALFLRMAGGEFCGNAAACAAAWAFSRIPEHVREGCPVPDSQEEVATGEERGFVRLRESGTQEIVAVSLREEKQGSFRTAVRMPSAVSIQTQSFSFGGIREGLPLVRMEGIAHILVDPTSAFYSLMNNPTVAEAAVRAWCAEGGFESLGLLFLGEEAEARTMTPLIYVPGSGTVFWEHSCASGTAAVGMAYARKEAAPVDLTLQEPGGLLRVTSAPTGETMLFGTVRILEPAVVFTPGIAYNL